MKPSKNLLLTGGNLKCFGRVKKEMMAYWLLFMENIMNMN